MNAIHVSVPLLEDRSCPVPCLLPLAHAPIMEGSIYGLTSRERQHVESEEAVRLPTEATRTVFFNKDESASDRSEHMAAEHL